MPREVIAEPPPSAQRSWNMSRIRSKDTSPEKRVRSLLHQMGYRFRLHDKHLPGRPDVVLPRLQTVVLVHGCFWHRHPRCQFAYCPKTRKDFWEAKFATNVQRDKVVRRALKQLGWSYIVVWECELRNPKQLAARLHQRLRSLEVGIICGA